MNKEDIEKRVVEKFLKNRRDVVDERDIISNPEEDSIVDVFYKEEKFQIIQGDFDLIKTRHTIPKNSGEMMSWRPPNEVFDKLILEPLKKKNEMYKESAKGIILLINSDLDYVEDFWVKDDIKGYNDCGWGFNIYFDEVHLVCPGENILVYQV